MGRRRIAIGLGVIGAASVWPYVTLVALWPTSRDAALWITRGTGPDWMTWVFATRHFVGYRPLTALSYSFNGLIGGHSAPAYRMTDLLLHAACVVMVGVAFRRWWPDRAAWGALVASAFFACHPLVENVVPELARRSYMLTTLFGLIAVTIAAGATTNARAAAAGMLAACAVLSHELGVVAAVVVLVASRRVVALIPAAVALALRLFPDVGVGGYRPEQAWHERVLPIVEATLRALGGRLGELRDGAEPFFVAVVAGVVLFYVWRAFAGRAYGAILWFGLLFVLLLPQGVWFARQTYPLLAPVALIVAVVLVDTVRERRWPLMVPQIFVLGFLLFASPLVHGMNPATVSTKRDTERVMRRAVAAVSGLEPADRVQLVLPYFAKPPEHLLRARERPYPLGLLLVEIWVNGVVDDAPAVSTLLVYDSPARPLPALEDGEPLILHRPARSWILRADGFEILHGGALGLQRPDTASGRAFIYIDDTTAGRLTRVDAPR